MFALKDTHKQHLSILFNQPTRVLQDFCRLAIDYLKKGVNMKHYTAAAQKLEVEVGIIQLAIEGLVHLLVESKRHALSIQNLRDSLVTIGFGEDQAQVIVEFHSNLQEDLDMMFGALAPIFSHYHDLEWRFEVQVASRALLSQTTPTLTMKLVLEDGPLTGNQGKKRNVLLQTDPNNLKHTIHKLELAIREAGSQHSQRIKRTFK